MSIQMLRTPEFWLVLLLSFGTAYSFTFFFWYAITELLRLRKEEEKERKSRIRTYPGVPVEVGCLVKDTQLQYIGRFAGHSDNGMAIVVFVLNKVAYYYETSIDNLVVVEMV